MNEDCEAVVPHATDFVPDGVSGRRWLVPPANLVATTNTQTVAERRSQPNNQPRYRLGWSLAIAAPANVLLGLVAIAFNSTTVGVVACATLGVASWLLVIAESICRYAAETRPDSLTIDHETDHRYRADWRDDGC